MGGQTKYLFSAIVVGGGATLMMDIWVLFLGRVFRVPSLSYCLVGRWLLNMSEGKVMHASISAAKKQRFECAVGWIAHYSIGVVFAIMFIAFVSGSWLARPTLLPATLFGIGTVLFPFLVMQPSFGLGIAASRTPHPMKARLKSLATHIIFGLGLYISALALSLVPQIDT